MTSTLTLYSKKDFLILQECGAIHKKIQAVILASLKIGVSQLDLNKIAKVTFKRLGAKSAFYLFENFPKHICISVNNEILHGVPNSRKFINGDVVKIDIGVKYKGFIVDGAFSVIVSTKDDIDKHKKSTAYKLLRKTYLALQDSIKHLTTKNRVGDFAKVFKKTIQGTPFYLINNYMGHGVGRCLHEEPRIPNSVDDKNFINWKIRNGMSLAIEPMIFDFKVQLETASDNWTIRSKDKTALAAHFEETVFVTDNRLVSLTKNEELNEDCLVTY